MKPSSNCLVERGKSVRNPHTTGRREQELQRKQLTMAQSLAQHGGSHCGQGQNARWFKGRWLKQRERGERERRGKYRGSPTQVPLGKEVLRSTHKGGGRVKQPSAWAQGRTREGTTRGPPRHETRPVTLARWIVGRCMRLHPLDGSKGICPY